MTKCAKCGFNIWNGSLCPKCAGDWLEKMRKSAEADRAEQEIYWAGVERDRQRQRLAELAEARKREREQRKGERE